MSFHLPLFECALILLAVSGPALGQDPSDQADRQTRRLAPSVYARLPAAVLADLKHRGCTIPQLWSDTVPGNVVSGHFRKAGQFDWAVLCSINRISRILVYWAGQADSVAELAVSPDKDFLQGVGADRIGYSRAIGVASAEVIRQNYQWYGGTEPPQLDHEGIEDAFVEKASVVWYWYEGKWLRLTGAD